MSPVGRHGIGTGHGTKSHGTLIGTLIAHHSNTLHGQQNHTGLPYLIIER